MSQEQPQNPIIPVQLKTATYALLSGDNGTEIQFESGSAVSANLPGVSHIPNGYNAIIRNVGTGDLTIDPEGSELIDGASTASLLTGEDLWIRSDGTEWKSISSSGSSSSTGGVLQVVYSQNGNVTTATNPFPLNNFVPTNTAGNQFLNAVITPQHVDNKLYIETVVNISFSGNNGTMIAALFRDSDSPAITAARMFESNNGTVVQIYLQAEVTAGTTNAIDFKVRAGGDVAGTTTFNGSGGNGFFGGVFNSFIKITEVAA